MFDRNSFSTDSFSELSFLFESLSNFVIGGGFRQKKKNKKKEIIDLVLEETDGIAKNHQKNIIKTVLEEVKNKDYGYSVLIDVIHEIIDEYFENIIVIKKGIPVERTEKPIYKIKEKQIYKRAEKPIQSYAYILLMKLKEIEDEETLLFLIG